jgi:hypothetical protein
MSGDEVGGGHYGIARYSASSTLTEQEQAFIVLEFVMKSDIASIL